MGMHIQQQYLNRGALKAGILRQRGKGGAQAKVNERRLSGPVRDLSQCDSELGTDMQNRYTKRAETEGVREKRELERDRESERVGELERDRLSGIKQGKGDDRARESQTDLW